MKTLQDVVTTVMNRNGLLRLLLAFTVLLVACPAPSQTVTVGSDTALTQSNVVLPITMSGMSDTTYAVELELLADSSMAEFLGIVVSQDAGILTTVSNVEDVSVQIQDGQGLVHQVWISGDTMRVAVADSIPFVDGLLCYVTLMAHQAGSVPVTISHTVQNSQIDQMTREHGSLEILDRTLADLNFDGVQDAQDALIVASQVIQEPSWQGRGQQPGFPLWKFQLADRNRDGYLQMIDSSLILQGR